MNMKLLPFVLLFFLNSTGKYLRNLRIDSKGSIKGNFFVISQLSTDKYLITFWPLPRGFFSTKWQLWYLSQIVRRQNEKLVTENRPALLLTSIISESMTVTIYPYFKSPKLTDCRILINKTGFSHLLDLINQCDIQLFNWQSQVDKKTFPKQQWWSYSNEFWGAPPNFHWKLSELSWIDLFQFPCKRQKT